MRLDDFFGDLKRPFTSFFLCLAEKTVGCLSYGSSWSHSWMICSACVLFNGMSESLREAKKAAKAATFSKPSMLSGPTDSCKRNIIKHGCNVIG